MMPAAKRATTAAKRTAAKRTAAKRATPKIDTKRNGGNNGGGNDDGVRTVTFHLVGTSALLMHNPRMVDPNYEVVREMKALTSKRKKTDADLSRIELLEWFGGLYVDDDDFICQPTSKPLKCFIETARITKQGKNVERALVSTSITTPLIYEGSDDPDELALDPRYISRLAVRVGQARAIFIEDAGLNFDELERIVMLAGKATGIGDNRVNGYGRFDGTVTLN
jgi:hypothetical protein